MRELTVDRVESVEHRHAARAVFDAVYVTEKAWATPGHRPFAPTPDISWFLARMSGEPAGLLRLHYDPPLDLLGQRSPTSATEPDATSRHVVLRDDVDWLALARRSRPVDIGRFMITPPYRRRPRVALRLMAAALRELVGRGATHLVTDVFEGEQHSPLDFHVRILGFEVIGWHDRGELDEHRRRLVLLLDIDRAYRTLRQRGGPLVETIIGDARDELEARQQPRRPVAHAL